MSQNNLPMHVAIIPDGNRSWAKKRNLKPWDGHEQGARNIEKITRASFKLGVKCLSFWGSSLENLKKRPHEERRALLRIYKKYFRKLIENQDIHKNRAKISIIGRWRENFPSALAKLFEEGMRKTAKYSHCRLNFFMAYNGDDEMIEAVKRIVASGLPVAEISGRIIKENLMTRDLPPVDLLIRTGGEPHLSVGFMMWDIANAQMCFPKKHFPDFDDLEFVRAVKEYQKRERRHGK